VTDYDDNLGSELTERDALLDRVEELYQQLEEANKRIEELESICKLFSLPLPKEGWASS
jgi:predicted nuclease with TOPRIM domain